MFVKLGELIEISGVENPESCISEIDPKILENFKSTASSLKRIAPKAEDFLYFSAIMMHAAEASALNYDGTLKVNASGKPVIVGWDKSDNTLRWTSNDPSVLPYKNSNGDIFPEEELVKAYKKWVGKPLCVDHKSSSVEHVRGFIVDTYYDRKLKRVVALCALDKAGYPQLARQVSTGVSTNVSMGTAVGRAVCTDCGRVARVESDFCNHMMTKSGYGEINLDLNPIELSIVVNGADPKANIKNVLAAANNLQAYLNSKQTEFNKLGSIDNDKLNELKNSLKKASAQLNDLSKDIYKISEVYTDKLPGGLADAESPENFDQDQLQKGTQEELSEHTNDLDIAKEIASDHLVEDPNYYNKDSQTVNDDQKLSPPHERFASLSQLTELKTNIEKQLSYMKDNLDKIANKLTEETMTKDMNKVAYHQGTSEPTKYPVDPLNESVRMQDKHMTGTNNMGGADGMVPGDKEKKELLSRAEEERAGLRQAVVNQAKNSLDKKAYPQGTEEPKTYPKDKLNDEARLKTDKHMVGKSPFPNTGKVDELFPGDKELKEKLSRASLKARFIKKANGNGTLDRDNCTWEVSLGDKLLLTASVKELSNDKTDLMYDSISSENFGRNLLQKIRSEGSDKVLSVIKKAQVAPMPVPQAAPAPVQEPVALEPALDMTEDAVNETVGDGDPADIVRDLSSKLRDLSSDLGEAVDTLVGEQPEMVTDMPVNVTAASDLNQVRKNLGPALKSAMVEARANINEHVKELDMLKDIYASKPSKEDRESIDLIVNEAIKEAKESATDGFKLITAFVKYARGTKALLKKAQLEQSTTMDTKNETKDADMKDTQLASDVAYADSELEDLVKQLEGTEFTAPKPGTSAKDPFKDEVTVNPEKNPDTNHAADCSTSEDMNDLKATKEELKGLEVKPGTTVEVTASDLSTKASRAAFRAKLAAESSEKHSLLEGNKSGMQPALDVKPSGDLAWVETVDETHKVMMDLAKAPVKVRKEAENIHKLISMGQLEVSDLDALVAEGLDAEAVKYYKKYYGQTQGGNEFAAELVKEHQKKAFDQAVEAHKVKVSRAYELAYDMASKGMISADRSAVTAQVNDILNYNDASFESLKKMVSRVNVKTASVMPQIGSYSDSDVAVTSLSDELSTAFSTTKNRLF